METKLKIEILYCFTIRLFHYLPISKVVKQDQKSHLKLNKSRSGQAVVEYVLMMVVIVGLIMGMAKVFKSLNSGMQSYLGDYFACLMEYGELPTLGVKDPELKKHTSGTGKVCDGKFEAFSFDAGRPLTSGSSSASQSGSGSSSNSASSSKKGDPNGTNGSNSSSSSNSGKDGAGADDTSGASALAGKGNGNTSGSSSPYKNGQIITRGSTYGTLDGTDDNSKVKILDDDDDTSKSGNERRSKRRPRSRRLGGYDNYRAISGQAKLEIEKSLKGRTTVRKPSSAVLKITAEEGGLGPYKKAFTPPVIDKTAQKQDKNDGFSLAGMLRWLIIAGMIVAIVIFFGGQLLNYSNSDS